jgi:chromosome partitioning protein
MVMIPLGAFQRFGRLMDFDNDEPELRSAHVIVVGNEKGGAGKSTLSIHLIVALLKAGYKVACIDLDTRQQTLTRFLENRRSWSSQAHWPIELPLHCAMRRGESNDIRANEALEFSMFADAIGAVEHEYEFVVIDTPAIRSPTRSSPRSTTVTSISTCSRACSTTARNAAQSRNTPIS